MPYYAAMATLGSSPAATSSTTWRARAARRSCASGCKAGHIERALALYRRHGLLALMVPALLPPPAPFKLFVLAAGVADVRPLQFVAAIAVARGARYLALGTARDLLRRSRARADAHARSRVALWLVGFIVVCAARLVVVADGTIRKP